MKYSYQSVSLTSDVQEFLDRDDLKVDTSSLARKGKGSYAGVPGLILDCIRFAQRNEKSFVSFVTEWRTSTIQDRLRELRERKREIEKAQQELEQEILSLGCEAIS